MDNYQQACGYTPLSIIECMILFGYIDTQGILLGDGEPWGSSFQGPSFPVGMSFPQILGIQLKVHTPAQSRVQPSRQSLFCFLLQPQLEPAYLEPVLRSNGSCHNEKLTGCNYRAANTQQGNKEPEDPPLPSHFYHLYNPAAGGTPDTQSFLPFNRKHQHTKDLKWACPFAGSGVLCSHHATDRSLATCLERHCTGEFIIEFFKQ